MDLKNIERDHRPMMCGCCAGCSVACKHGSGMHVFYPCDAARLLARVRELEAALPDPSRLELLADWIDSKYPGEPAHRSDVQYDLRSWAQRIRAALAGEA